ncbi:MAG TPA: glycogen synthase GlgA, partial [Burkholderiales bacterium]|nr:glycogen synthase GlgA [Burkholderiales bacterium]
MAASAGASDTPGKAMRLLFVAAEAYPLVKTGGLGDVAGALPASLRRLRVDARLLLPAYGPVLEQLSDVREAADLGPVLPGLPAKLLTATLPKNGLPLVLVDCPPLFRRDGGIYQSAQGQDWPDNHVRFGLLSRAAALAAVNGLGSGSGGWRPDLVHANDWHAGLVPYYLKRGGRRAPRSLFTVHNMAYQGVFGPQSMSGLALDPKDYSADGFEFWGNISFIKAGLVFADRISTVSPTYADEIQRSPLGAGLEGVLAGRRGVLSGIVNGVDDSVWDPARDEFIVSRYAAATLEAKGANAAELRRVMGLADRPGAPLFGMVSRLVEQKGVDLLAAAMPQLVQAGAQFAILGTGDAELVRRLNAVAGAHAGNVAVRIGYDEALAHGVIAGADMVLMPSRFEPCGLAQLYGQRYGSLPVVRT